MSIENAYIIFYKIADGIIYSYVNYNFEYDDEQSAEPLLNLPSKEKCASNNGVAVETIGIKKWTKEDPQEADFKNDIDDLNENDLEDIE